MPKYTAEKLETKFKGLARIRQNNPKFANDAGYWTGGTCNWGANHCLKTDCQTLSRGLGKIDDLGKMSSELKKATSQSEFEAKKQSYLTKCDEITKGLTPNYGSGSSMFGICIIWGDSQMNKYIQGVIDETKRDVERVKGSIEKENYRWVEEIRLLKLEEAEVQRRIKENKQKAENEKDPAKRALLLQLIEDDGKKLKEIIEKKAKLENRHNFDADKYVSRIIEAVKNAIENKHKERTGDGRNRNPRTPRTGNDSEDDNSDNVNSGYNNPNSPNKSNFSTSSSNDNNQQQLLIFAAIALVIIFLLLNKKEKQEYFEEY